MKNITNRINDKDFWTKLFFPFLGLASLIWFLIRVIPKPSRAAYPCMRVAAPIASSFILYMIGILGSFTFFRIAKSKFNNKKYVSGVLALFMLLTSGFFIAFNSTETAEASTQKMTEQLPGNMPVGEPKGIFPGRVVWDWNPDATNENCTNTVNEDGIIDENDDVYYLPANNDSSIIKSMLSEILLKLTGTDNAATAWDSVFTYFNRAKRQTTVGYSSGEKIFIKTNNQGVGLPHTMNSDLSQSDGKVWVSFPPHMAATSPYTILALLDQLVNEAGIPQDMIYVGDPHINFNNIYYDILSADFPDVHYMGVNANAVVDCESYGRTLSVPTTQEVVFYSDRGEILDDNSDKLYQQMYDATYMINIAALKSHVRGGITLFAKSHFGSHTESSAAHLHPGLPRPWGTDLPYGENYGYGKYRVLVDLMAHKHLGGKTILYILDGLWGGSPHELQKPRKWSMAPFSGDYTSSIFASIDPVAIASVAHDFLRTEYNVNDWGDEAYPNYDGTDDYLQQAADSSFWPENFVYDPENDGVPIKSLGVHEHWNNAIDKQYSKNLDKDSTGIELVKLFEVTAIEKDAKVPAIFHLGQNYPNPFNPKTVIPYYLNQTGNVDLSVYNVLGQKVETLVDNFQPSGNYSVTWSAHNFSSGLYFYRLVVQSNQVNKILERKMVLLK